MSPRILCSVGTRPEAIKMAPVILALRAHPEADVRVLATAQHRELLDEVLDLFDIRPDIDLDLMEHDQKLPELTARLITPIDEVLERSSHVNTIAPEDCIGAISRVLSVEQISDQLEAVRVKTLGLKNVDVEQELVDVEIPETLLDDQERKPSQIEAICADQCHILSDRIALQAVRTIIRPCC